MKHIGGKLWQLPYAGERSCVNEKWWEILRVAIARVHVEKEIGQGALQPRTHPAIKRKTGAGNLDGARQIENPGAFADLPMRARRKIELRRLSPAAHFDIGACVLTHGD